ncbi:hypothetical protein J5N97_009376 [Dioscorea zingiberensis]|uniref:S5 DRBM domain-containing protein n=1 Tax=Dioscorea zingiberensis TaxID=325984 RepID=A0A9D5HLX1_9LILI|nr:hypothetical protein J5N97_009376 [Dioscorea zingiberensis]
MEKLLTLEKKLEDKLAELDHTFGKKGRVLEEEIKDLVEERNALTEGKRRLLYRKGFDVKVIDINQTCKVTKGGQMVKYTALLATGNYHGVVGFAKAKGPTAKIAIQRMPMVLISCFKQKIFWLMKNVFKIFTMWSGMKSILTHAIHTKFEKTKIYLWPGPMRSGMSAAGRTVETIIGSRNPLNIIKALFKALNAIETPKDVRAREVWPNCSGILLAVT